MSSDEIKLKLEDLNLDSKQIEDVLLLLDEKPGVVPGLLEGKSASLILEKARLKQIMAQTDDWREKARIAADIILLDMGT